MGNETRSTHAIVATLVASILLGLATPWLTAHGVTVDDTFRGLWIGGFVGVATYCTPANLAAVLRREPPAPGGAS